jgi:hypothetical protein
MIWVSLSQPYNDAALVGALVLGLALGVFILFRASRSALRVLTRVLSK